MTDGTRRGLVSALVVALFLGATLPLLDDFGSTWDFGQLFYGERYLDALTGDTSALDFDVPQPDGPRPVPDLDHHRTEGPDLVWPLGPVVSAATHRLFHERLGWLPPVAAYHLASLLGTAALLGLMTFFLWPRLGATATLLSAVFLATHPAFLWHSLANFKDPVAAVLFVVTTMAAVLALRRGAVGFILAVGLLFGLALAGKGNALFLPVTVLVALPMAYGMPALKAVFRRRVFLSTVVGFAVAPLVAFAVWPWLWTDVSAHLVRHVDAVLHNRSGSGQAFGGAKSAFFGAPEVFLSGFFIGLLVLAARPRWIREHPERRPVLGVALALVLVPIVQASWPGAKHYDSVRRFLEFVPAAAVLAGAGFAALLSGMAAKPSLRIVRLVAAVLIAAATLEPLVRSHPDEHVFYNRWIGGLAGAQERGVPSAVDYWGHSYRRVFEWLREKAPEGATVYTPTGPQVARLSNEVWGREDLVLPGSGPLRATEVPDGPIYVAFVIRPEYQNLLASWCLQKLEPAFEVSSQGVVLAKVYEVPQNDAPRREELRRLADFQRKQIETRLAGFLEQIEKEPELLLLVRYGNETATLDGFDAAVERVEAVRGLPAWRDDGAIVDRVLEYLERNRAYLR